MREDKLSKKTGGERKDGSERKVKCYFQAKKKQAFYVPLTGKITAILITKRNFRSTTFYNTNREQKNKLP